mgnify:CR=1 FL=1
MLKDFKPEIKTFLFVLIVTVVISVAGILLLKQTQILPSASLPAGLEVTITGTIVDERSDCYVDGVCSFTVNSDKGRIEVITSIGWICLNDALFEGDSMDIGSTVEVFGMVEFSDTISACSAPEYYIKSVGFEAHQTVNNQQSTINTSTWQTYRNDEFGFEVRHPNNYYIKTMGERREGGLLYNLLAVEIYKDTETSLVTINVTGPNFVLGTRDWEDFRLGDIGGSISYNWEDWKMREKISSAEIIFRSDNNQGFFITTRGDPFEDKIINQILGTFRFVEPDREELKKQVDSTSLNWKDKLKACINEPCSYSSPGACSYLTPLLSQIENYEAKKDGTIDGSLEIVETSRGCITLPEDLYPMSKREFIGGDNASLGRVSNWDGACGGIDVGAVGDDCTGHGYEAVGNGSVLLRAKSAVTDIPDINFNFIIK